MNILRLLPKCDSCLNIIIIELTQCFHIQNIFVLLSILLFILLHILLPFYQAINIVHDAYIPCICGDHSREECQLVRACSQSGRFEWSGDSSSPVLERQLVQRLGVCSHVHLENRGQLFSGQRVPLRLGTDPGRVELHPLPHETPPNSSLSAAQAHVRVCVGGV